MNTVWICLNVCACMYYDGYPTGFDCRFTSTFKCSWSEVYWDYLSLQLGEPWFHTTPCSKKSTKRMFLRVYQPQLNRWSLSLQLGWSWLTHVELVFSYCFLFSFEADSLTKRPFNLFTFHGFWVELIHGKPHGSWQVNSMIPGKMWSHSAVTFQ